VYRQHQATMFSPCSAGEQCETCAQHAACRAGKPCRPCRRGKRYECDRWIPAEPAFTLKIRDALTLVRHGLARFINRNTAVQLTYSRLTQLRDRSCKVDERLILEYVAGSRLARAAVDLGWGHLGEA